MLTSRGPLPARTGSCQSRPAETIIMQSTNGIERLEMPGRQVGRKEWPGGLRRRSAHAQLVKLARLATQKESTMSNFWSHMRRENQTAQAK